MSNNETILEVVIVGGALTLSAQRDGSEWGIFSLHEVGMGLDADDNETWSSADFGPVATWDEALNLLDQVTKYWVTFHPIALHPDSYERLLADAERRALNLDSTHYERWKNVCLPRWLQLRDRVTPHTPY